MEKRLKPHQHYIGTYDRHTVEMCRRTEQLFDKDDTPLPKTKGVSKKQAERVEAWAKEWYLHMKTGDRYLNKEKTIREWMDADRKRDELMESTEVPEGIRCLSCRNLVKPGFKQLWSDLDKPDRILFMYDCPNKCFPRRAFFSDGEEWRIKPDLCPSCDVPLDHKADDNGKKLVTTRTCPKCKYVETDEYEWTHKKEEVFDANFAKDRDRFCLTDEQGREYQDEKYSWEQLGKLGEEWKKEDEAREEKLKANPNGFILEGVGRNCAICGNGSREDGSWYDQYGIKCLICQKAIDVGEIPASLAKNKDSWYSKWDIEHNFNLKTPTIKKWVKDGILKSRTVSHYGQGVHTELFLLEDNKGFLPPKKLLKGRPVKTRKDGKDWYSTQKWYEFQDPFKLLKGYKIMDHMRVVPPEEMKARKEEEKEKWEEKQTRREEKRKRKK